jgi:FkbM family methyltransferase
MFEKLKLRTIAYHLIGQPWVLNSSILEYCVLKFFFGNRFVPFLGGYHYFGQNQIDRTLKDILGQEGFFVEIGSNDGFSFSNSKHLEMYRGWKGVLVEPYYPKLRQSQINRSKRSLHVHAACVASGYGKETAELYYSNLMTTLTTGSDELPIPLDHAVEGQRFLSANERVHTFSAPAKTLKNILLETGAPRDIDLLSIDIEGHDYEVLADFDWSFRFRHIIVEAYNPDKYSALLYSLGYELVLRDSAHNMLFRLESVDK